MEGLVAWLYYFALFVMATGTLKKPADWWMVIRVAATGMALVVLYALAQLFRIDLFAMSSDRWRVESSLGNPVFLGGYLASAIPLLFVGAVSLKSHRWLAWTLLSLSVLVLICTLSRGAWIAGIVAVLLTLILYFYRYRSAWIKKTLLFLGVGLAVFVVLTIGWLMSPKDSAFRSIGERTIFRSESMLYRQNNWVIGWRSFIQKPLTGWGLENFHVAYDQNYQVFDRHVSFQESHVDRAHNEYVGVAVAGGLIALIPYLLMLGGAIYLGWRQTKTRLDSDTYLLNIGMLGAIVGYAAFVFTAFNLVTNILFLVLALAWANQLNYNDKKGSRLQFPKFAVGLLGLATLSAAYFTVLLPVQAVRLADLGTLSFQQSGDYNGSLSWFKKALAKRSFMSNTIRAQMSVISSSGSVLAIDNNQLKEFQKYTGNILQDIFKTEPYTSYAHMIVGMFYGNLSGKLPEFVPIADKVFQETVGIAPKKGETYLRWGETYANLGNWAMAEPKLEEAIQKDPNNYNVRFIGGVWHIWFGAVEEGNELVKRAIKEGHSAGFLDVKQIGDALEHANRHDKAELLYRQIIENPQNEQETVYATVELIDAYRRMGRWADAKTLTDQLRQYEIDKSELGQLIQDIENQVAPAALTTKLGY
jgi:tetratricopeptide (TPR) repeat protein